MQLSWCRKVLRTVRAMALVAVYLLAINVYAAVNIERTRVVINSEQKQNSFRLVNEGEDEVVVQLWTDYGDVTASPSLVKTPVFLQPPIFRLQPGEIRSVRAIVDRSQLAKNHNEQLYWINIYQVPQSLFNDNDSSQDRLQLPLRLRVKLLVRPDGVEKLEKASAEKLLFAVSPSANADLSNKKTQYDLLISNPTQWHITFSYLALDGKEVIAPFIAPGEQIAVPGVPLDVSKVSYAVINDNGNSWQYQQVIN